MQIVFSSSAFTVRVQSLILPSVLMLRDFEDEKMTDFKILGISGSLRKGSYNRALLQLAMELAPQGSRVEIFELDGIPPFNQDLERTPPDSVKDLKAKIRAADALLIASPEYNYSIPGVLKNAIDWASRPYGDNAFEDKPVAVVSASIGMLGGARAQYHLRQTFVFLNMHPVNKPEVMMPFAAKKVDANGRITDEDTKKYLKELLENLVTWSRKISKD